MTLIIIGASAVVLILTLLIIAMVCRRIRRKNLLKKLEKGDKVNDQSNMSISDVTQQNVANASVDIELMKGKNETPSLTPDARN